MEYIENQLDEYGDYAVAGMVATAFALVFKTIAVKYYEKRKLVQVAKQYSIPTDDVPVGQLYRALNKADVLDKIVMFDTSGFVDALLGYNIPSTNYLRQCNFESVEFVNGVKSTSASDSDLYIVKLKQGGVEMFMKVFMADSPSMRAETMYYALVTNLYRAGTTRNVLPCVAASNSCTFNQIVKLVGGTNTANRVARNLKMISSENRPAVDTQTLDRYQPPSGHIGYIMTIRAMNNSPNEPMIPQIKKYQMGTIHDYILNVSNAVNRHDDPFLLDQFRQYMFQIFFTLTAFSEAGFNHNDMHLGNTLLDRYYPGESKLGKYSFTHEGKAIDVWIHTPYIPRIFDFDRSTLVNMPNVSLGTREHSVGQCNNFMERRDFLKFTCAVVSATSHFSRRTSKLLGGWLLDMVTPRGIGKDSVRELYRSTRGCFFQNGMESRLCDESEINTLVDKPRAILARMSKYMLTNLSDELKQSNGYVNYANSTYNGGILVD